MIEYFVVNSETYYALKNFSSEHIKILKLNPANNIQRKIGIESSIIKKIIDIYEKANDLFKYNIDIKLISEKLELPKSLIKTILKEKGYFE